MTGGAARRDPRRNYVITAEGLRRVWLGPMRAAPSHTSALTTRQPAQPQRTTHAARGSLLAVAYSEDGALDDHARQVIAAAALLADSNTEVIAVVLGALDEDLASCGADRIIVLADCGLEQYDPGHHVHRLRALVQEHRPRHALFAERCGEGDLARRLAAGSGASIATHVVELGRAQLAVRDSRSQRLMRRAPTDLIVLTADIVDARLPFVGRGAALAVAQMNRDTSAYRDLGMYTLNNSLLPLEEARFVVAAGHGVTDIHLFRRLAEALGASIGASRVAVDAGHFSRDQQIGATGRTIAAPGYLAIGISGASQHLQGIKACRHVIAINHDTAAPIVHRADLAIIDDAQALMTALLDAVATDRHRQEDAA